MTTSPAVVARRTVVTSVSAGTAPSLPGRGLSFASCCEVAAALGAELGAVATSSSALC